MSKQISSLLDPAFCAQLEQLRLASRHRVLGRQSGQRTSRLLGSSLEFADYRSYAPGDDIRQVDWNAYARLGKWFLKMYLDEREITLHLLIDTSKSMSFGEPSKGDVALRLAAALGYIALYHTDRVGLITFRERVTSKLPVQQGKRGVHRLFSFLEEIQFTGKGDMNAAFSQPGAVPRERGLTVVLTDALFDHGYHEGLSRLQKAGGQVCLIHLSTAEERDPAWSGDLRLIDSETGNYREVSFSPPVLQAYRQTEMGYREELRHWCFRRGMVYIPIAVEEDLETILFTILRYSGLVR